MDSLMLFSIYSLNLTYSQTRNIQIISVRVYNRVSHTKLTLSSYKTNNANQPEISDVGRCPGGYSHPGRIRRAIHHRTGEHSGIEKCPNHGEDDPASR